jgi:hypothetical protein
MLTKDRAIGSPSVHGADKSGVTILKNSVGASLTGTGQGEGKRGDGGGGGSGRGGGVQVERLVPFFVGGGLNVCTSVNTDYMHYRSIIYLDNVFDFLRVPHLSRARTHICIC